VFEPPQHTLTLLSLLCLRGLSCNGSQCRVILSFRVPRLWSSRSGASLTSQPGYSSRPYNSRTALSRIYCSTAGLLARAQYLLSRTRTVSDCLPPNSTSTRLLTKVGVVLRLAIYRQSFHLWAKPLTAQDQSLFFFYLNITVTELVKHTF
jgi:hypothetical protein